MGNKLLVVNVFFPPKRFGGATIVAEQLVKHLSSKWEILVVTTVKDLSRPNYSLFRYRINGVNVIAINRTGGSEPFLEDNAPVVGSLFSLIVGSFEPDLVHFHSIQTMGAEMLKACAVSGTPYVVTVHDCWWICPRQFMVNNRDEYCNQKTIEFDVCQKCLREDMENLIVYGGPRHRYEYLLANLKEAEALLFPSKFQKMLYEANLDSPKSHFIVNKNGIKRPSSHPLPKLYKEGLTRFGFVGGKGPIKGFDQIKKAVEKIEQANFELVLVDNTLNLGFSSFDTVTFNMKGKLNIVPSYTQESIDDFFASIDVLLFPSRWKESFGLTVREALMRNVWVVATDGGGSAEDIVDGVNGTILPFPGDALSLKETMEELIEKDFSGYDNPYREKLVTFEKQAGELHDIYMQILNVNP